MKSLVKFILLIHFSFVVIIDLSSADVQRVNGYYRSHIYPFVPLDPQFILERAAVFTEDSQFVRNIYQMKEQNLIKGKTASQPWTGTSWGLNKGLIADPYINGIPRNLLRAQREFSWMANHQRLVNRINEVHNQWRNLNQSKLDQLSPSEKYDLLLGDETFDLTRKLRDYMYRWGADMNNSNLSLIHLVGGQADNFAQSLLQDSASGFTNEAEALLFAVENRGGLADRLAYQWYQEGRFPTFSSALPGALRWAESEAPNYVLKKMGDVSMALWEGICHGWATAAGHIPRPRNTVTFNLPNGKKLNFFPTDIKGLASLMFAHSLIQDIYNSNDISQIPKSNNAGILMEGLRCNSTKVGRDEWGRLVDIEIDEYDTELQPRCVGVHPALWHIAMINIVGKQGRSFIVDKKVSDVVWNYPVKGYELEFFNPESGKYGSLQSSLIDLSPRDQFFSARSPRTKSIVGVKMIMHVTGWDFPNRKKTDSEKDDKSSKSTMLYDLEIDEQGTIVGGQWRAKEVGKPLRIMANHQQPDFFWVVTKHWKNFFPENNDNPYKVKNISQWTDKSSIAPRDWLDVALYEHNFIYYEDHQRGWNMQCRVQDQRNGEILKVPCEFAHPRPRPMTDVVKVLVELSHGASW
jgi:hypothetical protein